ncbi:hypothetical protein AAC387_Pa08g2232 [Persea americana]
MPLVLALFLLAAFSSSAGTAESEPSDAVALLAFKSSVESDPSGLLADWNLTGKPYCLWRGVACAGSSGRVTSLTISAAADGGGGGSVIVGTLTPSIGDLAGLQILSIPHGALHGEIPPSIGRLGSLEILELQGNNLSGRIPDQISDLSSLKLLNLSYNSLSGPIPENLIGFSRVESIDLSFNLLSGGIRVNPVSRCESLTHLRLSGNYLVDNIPPEIGNCTNLRSLLIDGNIIEGRIPAELGRISELRVLDVSRNSLVGGIPRDLGNCSKLSVLVLTNLAESPPFNVSSGANPRVEFNAFLGAIPWEVLSIPSLEMVWAPRANIGGRLPGNWSVFCRLRVLNLGQNYITGLIPESLVNCRNLSFLDLSSNDLQGLIPSRLRAQCMVYLNVSGNSLSGSLPEFDKISCNQSASLFENGNGESLYHPTMVSLLSSAWMNNPPELILNDGFVVLHDFSWNNLTGLLPTISLGDGFLSEKPRMSSSYGLLLNNNLFNGSLPDSLFTGCSDLWSFAVNLSANQITGEINRRLLLGCLQLKGFEAAYNKLSGSIPPAIGDLRMLSLLDLSGNGLNGTLPDQLGKLRDLKWILLGKNSLTGEIPTQLGELASLRVLDLSNNVLTGKIPVSLSNASNLETILLNRNRLSGEIPSSFSMLAGLSILDVSFNELSGRIPHLKHVVDCALFQGNSFLPQCPDSNSMSPTGFPFPMEVRRRSGQSSKLKSYVIAAIVSACLILFVLMLLVLVLIFGRKKLVRLSSLRRKVVMTFTDAPAELNYDNVVRATGNFSIRNLIGTGGFGATYKAELVPGFLVAVKRLSIGRFQGLQQFDAEIRTLGRIRHKNLVTLIGYHMGEADTFLIYNYLSGGNLESFIHDRSGKNTCWPVIHKIALDVAHALAYLHYSCVPRIVHRDIKPSNILLDEDLNAYLSDFGLARLLEVSETHATTDVAGTFGYVAPEYATTCRVSDKSDVYSFGVVLLELMSGKKSLDPSFSEYGNGFNIVTWGKLLIMEGRPWELFSPMLWEGGPKDPLIGMMKLALACTVESLSVRPTMKQVVEKLKQLKDS